MFSDRGIPDGYRMMNGYGSHTFKNVNVQDEVFYVKYHFKTDQGIRNLTVSQAAELSGSHPDYAIQDLYDAIATCDFPTWTMYIQVMSFETASSSSFDPFDVTKIWSHKEFPLIEVGRIVLNRNPVNYFAQVEQMAFSPAHMVPGIEASPDKMLQGRLFSYSDTHRHRLGVNYQQLPVNAPLRVTTYQRDGVMSFTSNNNAPNYFPNSFKGPKEVEDTSSSSSSTFSVVDGPVKKYSTKDNDNFSQCGDFYRNVLSKDAQERLVENIARNLKQAQSFIQDRAVRIHIPSLKTVSDQ